jgi:monolysocardiolipin acyltransferase
MSFSYFKLARNSTLLTVFYTGYTAYASRATCDLTPSSHHPKGRTKDNTWGGTPGWDWKIPTPEQLAFHNDRDAPYRRIASDRSVDPPIFTQVSQWFTVAAIDRVIASLMAYYNNSFTIVDDVGNYESLIGMITKKDRDVTVLTVSNHCCTLDDPIIFGKILPSRHSLTTSANQRWSLCSQEVCFKNPALGTFFTAGKVMPIKRGAGINQKLLLEFSRIAARGGEWMHVFPEGKIYQSGQLAENYYLARSDEKAGEIGRLKWGVAKIIVHCPKKIVVVPFHHAGMEGVIPQYATGQLKTNLPMADNTVTARVGVEISFSDLIEEHEREYGKLWKYSVKEYENENWESSVSDMILYQKVTLRIEQRIKALEMRSVGDGDEKVRESREGIRKNLETEQDGFKVGRIE